MKKVCSVCGRFTEILSESEIVDDMSISHGFCARCAILQYSDLLLSEIIVDLKTGKKTVNDSEALALIESEMESKIVWQGEEKNIFKPEQQKIYNDLLKKVEKKIKNNEMREMTEGRLNRK